jgi:hypothetical protein
MDEKEDQVALAIKYFLENYNVEILFGRQEPSTENERLAEKYLTELTEVFAVFDRLIRYEKYFKDFIPPQESGISESEALEYHLRSYIGDFYILQERIKHITDHLIEDLMKYNLEDKEDAVKALKHLSDKIHSKFKPITSGLRREHVHERSTTEMDFVTGKFIHSVLTNEIKVPEGWRDIEQLEKRYEEVSTSSRAKHTKQSAENSKSLREIKQWFAARFIYIFAMLNGHTVDGLDL